jgi:hypothetical protein
MKRAILMLIISIFIISLFADGTNTNVGAPIVNALPFTDTGDLIDNTDDNSIRYRDEWWEITPTIDLTNVDIHPLYNGWDGYLFIYDANLNQIASDDDGPGGTADSQIIMDIAAGQTIYVVVDEYSSSTDARTFTLNISADQTGVITDPDAPEMISNINPPSGATDVALLPTLTWDFGADTETYDLYFDTVYPPVTQVGTGAASGATGSYTPAANLVEFTTYYWMVVCHNTTTTTETINNMNFTTLDMSAGHITNASPANSSLNVPLDAIITWDFAANAETYDLYFDTVNPPVTQIVTDGTVSGPGSYTPTGLQTATFYYWKVVSKNSTSLRDTEDLMNFQTTLGTDVLTIGNGTEINHHLPIEPYYGYSYSQTIYLQSEINTPSRRIEKVYYQYNMAATLNNCNDWIIYMSHTPNSSFASTSDWLPISQFTEVYNGPLPAIPADGWIEFVLTTPFVYNNTDNLVIAVEENQPNYGTSAEEFYGTTVAENRSIYYYSDSNNPDPLAPPTASATPAVIPNTRLYFGDIPAGAQMMYNPQSHNYGTLFTNTASSPVSFMMQNTGLGTLNIQSVTIDDAVNYTLTDNNTYPLALTTAQSASFSVTFNPVNEGPLPATVTLTDDLRQSYTITLSGTGFNATVANYPYTQSFDTNTLPIEWTTDPATGAWVLANNEFGGHGATQDATGNGGYYIGVDDSSPETVPAHLYSPPFDLTGLTNPILAFYYWIGDSANTSTLNIDVTVGGTTTSDVAVISEPDGASAWTYYEVPLAAYVDQIASIDFRAMESTSFYGDICVDDISVYDNSIPPSPTSAVVPLDGATGVAMTGTLSWLASQGSSGYYLSMGTDNPPTDVLDMEDVGNALSYDYSGLTAGTVYYWQVVPYNPIGNASNCPVWSFTSFNDVPLAATLVSPTDGAQAVIETPTLQWANGGQFPDGYKLNMGTDNPPTNLYDEEDLGNVTSYDITTPLGFQTTYYWQIVPYNFVGDAVNCPVWSFTTNSNQNYGGDGTIYGGYYFANSTVSGNGLGYQPVFEWVDISATGQAPAYSNADDGFVTVDIGFPFNFFGNDYTQVSLGTNGSIMFTNPTGSTSSSMSIPSTTTPNDCVAMMAMDLHTTNIPSACYYGADEMGNFVYTVMMWNDYTDTSEYMDIQVILYPTGRIKIQYDNYMNPNGDTGTSSMLGDACIGIENADGTLGHQYRNNGVGGPINNQMALCYAQSTSDLSDGGAGLYLPGNIEYGVVNVNNNSTSYQVRMRNFTDADVTVASAPVMSGDNVDQFIVTDNNTYPLVIASGGEANLNIVFHPTSMGHKTAMMTIVDDAVEPTRISHDITMHGYGHIPDTNNTSATATEFAIYDEDVVNYQAIIEPATDIDWYVFWQTGPAEITMHTEQMNGSSVDLAAFIYGPFDDIGANVDEFASIDFSDDDWSDGISPSMATDVTESGFYYLRIARADNSPVRARDSRRAGRDSGQNWGSKASQGEAEPTDQRIERWDTGDYALWIHTNNPTPPAGFFPPSGLDTQITYQGINLTWFEPVPPPADRTLNGYNVYRDDVIINPAPVTALFYLDPVEGLVENQQYEYKITALYSAPAGESPACDSVMVTYISVDPPVIAESFEDYSDFVTTFGDWVVVDGDGENTYGFNNGINFPGENDAMAFIVFNPASTTPPLQFATAYSGDKYAACFAADTGSNDDWLISPQIQLTDAEAYVQLMARSYTTQFGMERFEVAVSNGSSDPDDFTVITGDQPIEVPLAWTPFSYSLDDFATDIVRVAVHCVSNQTFFMMLDDLMIVNDGAEVGNDPQPIIPEVTALTGNYPNPFNPVTTISFDLKENAQVSIDIYNIKGQRVATVADGNFNAGRHSIIWKGTDLHGNSVSSGVYFYKMSSGTYTKTKKMILMK